MDTTDPNDAETLIRFADFLDLVKPTDDTPVTMDDVVAALRRLRRYLDDNRAVVSASARQQLLDEAVRPFVTKFAQWPVPARVLHDQLTKRFAEAFDPPSQWTH